MYSLRLDCFVRVKFSGSRLKLHNTELVEGIYSERYVDIDARRGGRSKRQRTSRQDAASYLQAMPSTSGSGASAQSRVTRGSILSHRRIGQNKLQAALRRPTR